MDCDSHTPLLHTRRPSKSDLFFGASWSTPGPVTASSTDTSALTKDVPTSLSSLSIASAVGQPRPQFKSPWEGKRGEYSTTSSTGFVWPHKDGSLISSASSTEIEHSVHPQSFPVARAMQGMSKADPSISTRRRVSPLLPAVQDPTGPSLATSISSSTSSPTSPKANRNDLIPSSIRQPMMAVNGTDGASEIERRLEEAVRQLCVSAQAGESRLSLRRIHGSSTSGGRACAYSTSVIDSSSEGDSCNDSDVDSDEDGDNNDMYSSIPASSSVQTAYAPLCPLDPLDVAHVPSHRAASPENRSTALRRARTIRSMRKLKERRVSFNDTTEVVNVFAAVDYPARRGPPPVERLSMRDVLELRQIKLELGILQAQERENTDESTSPFPMENGTPYASITHLADDADLDSRISSQNSSAAGSTNSSQHSSPATSLESFTVVEHGSIPCSPSHSSSRFVDEGSEDESEIDPDTTLTPMMRPSNRFVSPIETASTQFSSAHAILHSLRTDRDGSPESDLSSSSFTSPSPSLSCSPSASESDCWGPDDEHVDSPCSVFVGVSPSPFPSGSISHAADCGGLGNSETAKTPTKRNARSETRRSRNADYFSSRPLALPKPPPRINVSAIDF